MAHILPYFVIYTRIAWNNIQVEVSYPWMLVGCWFKHYQKTSNNSAKRGGCANFRDKLEQPNWKNSTAMSAVSAHSTKYERNICSHCSILIVWEQEPNYTRSSYWWGHIIPLYCLFSMIIVWKKTEIHSTYIPTTWELPSVTLKLCLHNRLREGTAFTLLTIFFNLATYQNKFSA